jgi:hypothetical protein
MARWSWFLDGLLGLHKMFREDPRLAERGEAGGCWNLCRP